MRSTAEILRSCIGGTTRVTFAPACVWCHKPSKQLSQVTVRTIKLAFGQKRHEERGLCHKCEKHVQSRDGAWREQLYSRIEVLSVGAAEIARREFSKKMLRDEVEFKVSEPEQTYLGVWRRDKVGLGHAQTRNGRWIYLHEVVDTFVPFTLATTRDGRFKDHEKSFARFWRGMGLIVPKTKIRKEH